jgi:hypothetical protein
MEIDATPAEVVLSSPEVKSHTTAAATPDVATGRTMRKIKVGDNLILCLNDDKFIFAQVQPTGYVVFTTPFPSLVHTATSQGTWQRSELNLHFRSSN